ncbi:MAG: hypothetical protein Unbinned5434contig1000_31 [Prokaryotic dsDNA virus sp.]|nr:MAG: hypothetical protein Unbinned5434contig1000_31 [Prokaryotic dsDNA virus sp.]|tara:strand:- start:3750 stop:5438 length:1689 start_codon:yes stop_codon:yes gene_type:complete
MANKKFSDFTLKTDSADVDFVVGYDGTDNVRIAPSDLSGGGGGASTLNDLTDCLVDGNSVYVSEVPSGLSGNPIDNTILGIDAGQGLTTGFGNTFIGFEAAKLITDSDNMVIIGRQAGNASSSNGDRTVAIGYDAHGSSMSTDNVAIGYAASQFSGVNFCIAIGSNAALFNGAANSISIGYQTNYSAQSGAAGIISIGYQAGRSNTSGTYNTNIGYQSHYANTTGSRNVSLGYEAGRRNVGSDGVFIGYQAGFEAASSLNRNTMVGAYAGKDVGPTRFSNTFIGYNSGRYYDSNVNCFVGSSTGRGNTNGATGFANVAVGGACFENATSGSRFISIGYQCLKNGVHTGSSIIAIGSDIHVSDDITGSNSIVIGHNASLSSTSASNEITLGDSNITAFRIPGLEIESATNLRLHLKNTSTNSSTSTILKIERGTGSSPHKVVEFFAGSSSEGSITVSDFATAYNTSSDYRLKENVQSITNAIDRVKQLNPKRFNFIGNTQIVDGFLAHEAGEVVPESVQGEKDAQDESGNPIYQGIDQSKLVPLLTAALKEAIIKIEQLESKI